jgi:acyl-CoA reductase-like NAD-dependent aldehyde dehydrogenase
LRIPVISSSLILKYKETNNAVSKCESGTRGLLQSFIEHSEQQMIDSFTDIAPENPAFKQEFFGPVTLLFSVNDEEETIALANNSPVVLGGSVYTTDIEPGKRVASCIETGMVFINYPSLISPDLPIGGIKRSGNGKVLSNPEIEEFINKRLVCVANRPSLRRVNGVDSK